MFMENSGAGDFFNNQGRIGEDELGLSQTNLQNILNPIRLQKKAHLLKMKQCIQIYIFQKV